MEAGGGGMRECREGKEEVGAAEMGLAEDARWWAGAESLEVLIQIKEQEWGNGQRRKRNVM